WARAAECYRKDRVAEVYPDAPARAAYCAARAEEEAAGREEAPDRQDPRWEQAARGYEQVQAAAYPDVPLRRAYCRGRAAEAGRHWHEAAEAYGRVSAAAEAGAACPYEDCRARFYYVSGRDTAEGGDWATAAAWLHRWAEETRGKKWHFAGGEEA